MKKIFFFTLLALLLIQLIRPSQNKGDITSYSIEKEVTIPKEVQQILKTSCYDCHSNATTYPWYANIAPVSWYIAHHVNEGKEHANFSEWTTYNIHQKQHIINDLEETIEKHEMPLKTYLLKHPEATLSLEQEEALLQWIRSIKIH